MAQAHPKRNWPGLLACVACLVCVAGFSAGQFANGFVHDDLPMLRAGFIDDPHNLAEVFRAHALVAHGSSELLPMDTYRPLSILTFFWDAWLSAKAPWSYHLTNLLLHLACAACVFAWTRLLVPQASLWVVAFATLFFGLSPQLVEAHVWINGRSDPLATLFGVGALLLWQQARKQLGSRRTLKAALAALLFLGGLLSKEILLFTLPAVVLWPALESQSLVARVRAASPLLMAGVVSLALRSWALGGLRSSRDSTQLLEAAHNLPILWLDGLRELLWPTQLYLRGLHEEYASLRPWQYALLLGAIALLSWLGLVLRKRLPVLCWSLFWFAASLAPAALISALLWPGFGRYLYLPCAGLALGLAEGVAWAERKVRSSGPWWRATLIAVCAVYLLSFGLKLVHYTRDYADERTLYAAAIRHAPERAHGYARMAGLFVSEGKVDAAIPLYAQAVRLEPREPSYALQAIFWNLRVRNFSAAERLARAARTQAPAQADAFTALLIRALAERDTNAAIAELCACLTRDAQAAPCLEAPRWLLDPEAARFQERRVALLRFADTCPSQAAQRALTESLRPLRAAP